MAEHDIIDLVSSDDDSVSSSAAQETHKPAVVPKVVAPPRSKHNFGRGLVRQAVQKKTGNGSGGDKKVHPPTTPAVTKKNMVQQVSLPKPLATAGTSDLGPVPKKKMATARLSAPKKHSSAGGGTSKAGAVPTQSPPPVAKATAIKTSKDDTTTIVPPPPTEEIPSPQAIKTTCWVCEIPLTVNFGFCMYTMHKHPLLEAPCCFVCAETVAALSVAREEDNEQTDDDDDICAACGSEDNDFLVLCDDCDRQYCQRCLARAYGGGSDGWEYVQTNILGNKAATRWVGPCCAPPAFLQRLVEQVEQEKAVKDENRNLETILDELHQVYEERQHTLTLLDNEDEKRREFAQELHLEQKLDDEALEEAVESEMEAWREEWNNHLKRLEYHEATLQDEIERVGGTDLDLPAVYESMGISRPKVMGKEDPEWVRAAEFALIKRDMEEQWSRPAAPFNFLQDDDYDDVEDLVDSEDDEAGDNAPVSLGAEHRSGFRTQQPGAEATKEAIAQTKMMEEESHPFLTTAKKVTERADCTACEQEEITASCRGFRSDEKVIVQSRRKAISRRKQTSSSARDKNRIASRNSDKYKDSASSKKSASSEQMTLEPDPLPTLNSRKRATSGCTKFDLSSLPVALQEALKPHQLEGINFMYDNCFGTATISPGGCVLAHNMGLGKTATALAFLCAATNAGLVQRALICVPTNTIGSWKREFGRWIGYHGNALFLEDLDETKADSKSDKVRNFMRGIGGIDCPRALLCSHGIFPKIVSQAQLADIVIIDEAHIPLKTSTTQGFKAFLEVKTKLRIALTGTPISNNLTEYHTMMHFIRPGLLPAYSDFERYFITPIKRGLPKDCTAEEKHHSDKKSEELFKLLKPFVNRKDASPLFDELPELTQVALYISPSKLQQSIYRSFKLLTRKDDEFKNFFQSYRALAPIHNHPATLLRKNSQNDDDNADVSKETKKKIQKWWMHLRKRNGEQSLTRIDAGYKFVLLLQLLVMAEQRGEKVLVFSGCMKTLDFLEEVLQSAAWRAAVPGPVALSPSAAGAWQKDTHYFRIDGTNTATYRSKSIQAFESSSNARAFLLSLRAGGLGISLTSATRVVLLETDFNPTVSLQAIFRCYRYGQTQPVFAYRFLTRGTMEEKIHARCVTKSGLAQRVIDKKTINRDFSAREIADLSASFNWVQCDKCNKWRVLYDYSGDEELPKEWFCSMNTDLKNNMCAVPEREPAWYEDEIAGKHDGEDDDVILLDSDDGGGNDEDEHLVQQDPILQSLLELTNSNQTKIITKYKFQRKPPKSKSGGQSAASTASTVTEESRRRGQWRKPSTKEKSEKLKKTVEGDRAIITPQSPSPGSRSKRRVQPTLMTPTSKMKLEGSSPTKYQGAGSPLRKSPRHREASALRQTAVYQHEANSQRQTSTKKLKKRKAPASPSSPHQKVDKKAAPAVEINDDNAMDGETALPEGAFLV